MVFFITSFLLLQKMYSMKQNKIFRIAILIAAFGFMSTLQSCTKALQGLKFNLGLQTQSVSVDVPVTPAGSIAIGPLTSTYNLDSFIKAQTGNQLGVSNISSVKLVSVVITINNPDANNNFANFQSVNASFYSNTNSTPYAISLTNNPNTYATSLSLPVNSNDELKGYFGTQYTYNISGDLRSPITTILHCTVQYSYNLIVQG